MPSSYSFSSTTISSSETRNGTTTNQSSYTEEQRTDPSGTTTLRSTTTQNNPGAPAVQDSEVRYFDAGGHEVPAERAAAHRRGLGGATAAPGDDSSSRRIEDVSDHEQRESDDVDRLYRERMEDEYAKREGGA